MSNQNRVLPGVTEGGQFTTTARGEADVTLAAPSYGVAVTLDPQDSAEQRIAQLEVADELASLGLRGELSRSAGQEGYTFTDTAGREHLVRPRPGELEVTFEPSGHSGDPSPARWRDSYADHVSDHGRAVRALEKASVGTAASVVLDRYPEATSIGLVSRPGGGARNVPARIYGQDGQVLATYRELAAQGQGDQSVAEALGYLQRDHREYPFIKRSAAGGSVLDIQDALQWARTTEENP